MSDRAINLAITALVIAVVSVWFTVALTHLLLSGTVWPLKVIIAAAYGFTYIAVGLALDRD